MSYSEGYEVTKKVDNTPDPKAEQDAQAIIDMLTEINDNSSDDQVFLDTHRVMRTLVQPSKDPEFKGAVINSPIFTKIVERIEWILMSETEMCRIEAANKKDK